jgi:uncharacterized membrane protein YedE/YeeE
MMKTLAGLLAGLVFGGGLALSRMVDPGKVLDFLDVWALPQGGWDPSLAFVMGGALAVTAVGYLLVRRRGQPLFDNAFQIPTARHVDGRLVGGAALFGLGWGLVGYCPGPAIAGLAYGKIETLIFVGAMIAGMALYRATLER